MSKKPARAQKSALQFEKRQLTIGLAVLAVAILGIAAVALLGGGNAASTVDAAALPATISTTDGYALYEQGDVFVLDVREQDEWDAVHIPNTTLIPLSVLETRLAEVPTDQPIVVVCRSGNRSDVARDILLAAGYTNVTSMDGGLTSWESLGYPVE